MQTKIKKTSNCLSGVKTKQKKLYSSCACDDNHNSNFLNLIVRTKGKEN